MFFWFERRGEYLRYEVQAVSTSCFELRVIAPDGTVHVERFCDSDELAKRQEAVQNDLSAHGWCGPHGWNI
jgi:hypothetical protein